MGFGGASAAKVEELIEAAHTITDGLINTIDVVADAVKERTDNLPDDPADESGLVTTVDTNIDTLLVRLSAAKSSYLNELAPAHIPADLDTLKGRLSEYRAGLLNYLTELAASHIPADIDTLLARLTAARATNLNYLTELGSAHIPADIDTLKTRLSAARAGFMDALNRGRPSMIFPSLTQAIVVIPGTGADLAFPSVTIAGLPSGLSIIRADLVLVIGGLKDTSGSENQIKVGTSDQLFVKKAADAWADGSPKVIAALTFTPLGLQVDGNAYRGGPIVFGAIDIKGVITADGIYHFRSDETVATKGVEATAGTIELLDVSLVVRVWFN